jgi:hypothetical protein
MQAPTEKQIPDPPKVSKRPWPQVFLGNALLVAGGLVSVGYGMMACGYLSHRIHGGRASSAVLHSVLMWSIFGAAPLVLGRWLASGCDRKRSLRWGVFCLVLLTVAAADEFSRDGWRGGSKKPPPTDASALKGTFVSAHLETPIVRGTNLLWCGTFQLAWDEACRLLGGDLRFVSEPPMVAALNLHRFTKESLDAPSYLALAGFVKDNIHQQIQNEVQRKFHGAFTPRFIPDKNLTPFRDDVVAYACLYKKIVFANPFERIEDRLTFDGVPVPAFGFGPVKDGTQKLYPQVLILDYQSEDDFVVELKSTSEADRLILAKIKPNPDLATTITSVFDRIAKSPVETATTHDILLVPRMSFDMTRQYEELHHLKLRPRLVKPKWDLYITRALQNTRFEMNERGVELKSEAHMNMACAAQPHQVPKHTMVFDQPFLVLMQRRAAAMPYFALWVDNPEILGTVK